MNITEIITNDEVYEPETLRTLYPEFSDQDIEKLQVTTILHKTKHFWENMYIFENMCRVLNDLPVDFRSVQGLRPEHIWYAVSLASQIHPEREYSFEVQKYVQWISNQDGVYIYPPEMKELYNPYYINAEKLANSGIVLNDVDVEHIQAIRLQAILLYIENQKAK